MDTRKTGRKKKEQSPELIAFGTKLYNLRQSRNLSYTDLENITEKRYGHMISRSSWSKYEHGTADPGFTNLRIMSDLFNVSTDFLLGLTDKAYKEGDIK